MGTPPDQFECRLGVDAVDKRQRTLGLLDGSTAVSNLGDSRADALLAAVISWRGVDVEPLSADDCSTGLVVESFADDDYFPGVSLRGDDAMAGAERRMGSTNSRRIEATCS